MIIDFHTHAYPKDKARIIIERNRRDKLSRDKFLVDIKLNGTIEDLISSMKQCGIDYSVLLPVATSSSDVLKINDWTYEMCKTYDNLIPFGTIHPDFYNYDEEIKRIKSLGFKGIKIHPLFQSNNGKIDPLDERFLRIYDKAQSENLIILFDTYFPDNVLNGIRSIKEIVKTFGGLNIVASHLGGLLNWDISERELIGEDIYMDISSTTSFIDKNRIIKIMRKHGVEKLLFGTDSPYRSPHPELERFLKLSLSDEEKEIILYKNASKILDLKV